MKNITKKRKIFCTFTAVSVLLIIIFLMAVQAGSIRLTADQWLMLFSGKSTEELQAVIDLRFPRIFITMLAGAAIAVAGVLFQAVLKNPLADPGIIGILSGAEFAALFVAMFLPGLYFFMPLAAFWGGVAAFLIVYLLTWQNGLNPIRMILMGIAVNAFFVGAAQIFKIVQNAQSVGANIEIASNISQKTWNDVYILLPYIAGGLFLAFFFSSEADLMLLEDKTIRSLGVDVAKTRIAISLVAVFLASISAAVVGVVSFLGLIVPHVCRLIVGNKHKVLLPFCTLAGAGFFMAADTIGRTIARPAEISANILTSIAGGIFLIVLLKGKRDYE